MVISGANRGGKSTFLRALGVAQLMAQAGMFVTAGSFEADARSGIFAHFRREEDRTLRSGKLDEELVAHVPRRGRLPAGVRLRAGGPFGDCCDAPHRSQGMTCVAISIGAVLGANARFLVGGWVADRSGATFPWGTLLINTSGSFGLGFLGSGMTFSTVGYETLRLVDVGRLPAAAANVAEGLTAALLGVSLGTILARAM